MGVFKLSMSPTFWAQVKAEVTAESGSKLPVEFGLQFKRLTVEEFRALNERTRADEGGDAGFLAEIVTGWRGVEDESGSDEYSPDGLKQLVNRGFAAAMIDAFVSALPKAKAKN